MDSVIIQLPSELFAVAESSHFEGELALDQLEVGPDTYSFDEPLAWQVDITNTGDAFLVAGTVNGQGRCACSRCLEDVPHDFTGDIEGYFLMEGGEGESYSDDDEELGEDEFEVLPEDHRIDLEPLIKAALIVDAPSVPLCKDECQGLCPQCGANLNEGPCACGEDPQLADFERESNPFSVLADYEFGVN